MLMIVSHGHDPGHRSVQGEENMIGETWKIEPPPSGRIDMKSFRKRLNAIKGAPQFVKKLAFERFINISIPPRGSSDIAGDIRMMT